MPEGSIRRKLKKLETKPTNQQHDFIAKYQDKFHSEPLIPEEIKVKRGDHLKLQGKIPIYYHHAVCVDADDDEITVIEYSSGASSFLPSSQSTSSSDIGRLGGIIRTKHPLSYFKERKAEIIQWPDELKRFTPDEIVERAKSREGENYYSILKNNCEHFVTWCICGLRVSLQVKSWHVIVKESFTSVIYGVETGALIVANASDKIISWLRKAVPTKRIFYLGALIEAGIATYEIWKAYNQWQNPKDILIRTKWDFGVKILEILLKICLRFGLGYLGSKYSKEIWEWIGQYWTQFRENIGSLCKWIGQYWTQFREKFGSLCEWIGQYVPRTQFVEWIGQYWTQFCEKIGSLCESIGSLCKRIGQYVASWFLPSSQIFQSYVCGAFGGVVGYVGSECLVWLLQNYEYIVNSG